MNWLNSLPNHLHPSKTIARELDAFRDSIDCPDEPFVMRILGSGWAIRKTQELVYEQAKQQNPGADDATLARIVYDSRQQLSESTGNLLPPLPESCRTFKSVVEFIVNAEAKRAMPDPYGWGKRIDSILARD